MHANFFFGKLIELSKQGAGAPGPVGVRLGAMRPTPAGRGRQGHFGEAELKTEVEKR